MAELGEPASVPARHALSPRPTSLAAARRLAVPAPGAPSLIVPAPSPARSRRRPGRGVRAGGGGAGPGARGAVRRGAAAVRGCAGPHLARRQGDGGRGAAGALAGMRAGAGGGDAAGGGLRGRVRGDAAGGRGAGESGGRVWWVRLCRRGRHNIAATCRCPAAALTGGDGRPQPVHPPPPIRAAPPAPALSKRSARRRSMALTQDAARAAPAAAAPGQRGGLAFDYDLQSNRLTPREPAVRQQAVEAEGQADPLKWRPPSPMPRSLSTPSSPAPTRGSSRAARHGRSGSVPAQGPQGVRVCTCARLYSRLALILLVCSSPRGINNKVNAESDSGAAAPARRPAFRRPLQRGDGQGAVLAHAATGTRPARRPQGHHPGPAPLTLWFGRPGLLGKCCGAWGWFWRCGRAGL